MWKIRTFRTIEARDAWLLKMDGFIQFEEIFVNNGYGIEFRPLRKVY